MHVSRCKEMTENQPSNYRSHDPKYVITMPACVQGSIVAKPSVCIILNENLDMHI